MSRTRRIATVLVSLWVVVVAYLGFTASRGVVGLSDSLAEPVQHFVSFAVIAALLLIAFPESRWRIGAALVIAGIIGEFLQLATDDRQFAVTDIGMNVCGIAVGLTMVTLAGDLTGPVFGLTIVLLVAGPFVLSARDVPETSFPSNCATPPARVGDEPIILIDGLSDLEDPGTNDISMTRIKEAIIQTSEFSVEAWFDTPDLQQTGPARVFTISDGIGQDEVNFHLGVDGSSLSIRFRTACELFNRVEIDDVIKVGRPQHVVVNWSGGVVETWVDGALADRTDLPWGDLTNWDTGFGTMVGDEVGGGRAFNGHVLGVTMWDRALDERTIAERRVAIP